MHALCFSRFNPHSIDDAVMIRFGGLNPSRPELRVIWHVRDDLRVQRDSVVHSADMLALADQPAVEEIASVDFESQLIGHQFQHSAGGRIVEPAGEFRFGRLPRDKDEL
jgi:hypothetical protein